MYLSNEYDEEEYDEEEDDDDCEGEEDCEDCEKIDTCHKLCCPDHRCADYKFTMSSWSGCWGCAEYDNCIDDRFPNGCEDYRVL